MKKLIALLLAVVMVVGLFAACGTKPAETTEGPKATQGNNNDKTPDATDAPEVKSHTLHCLVTYNASGVLNFADRENYTYWKVFTGILAEEGLTLEMELVPGDQYATVIQTRLASGTDLPDYAYIGSLDLPTAMNMANQGMFIDIDSILEYSDGTAKEYMYGKGDYSRKLNTMEDGKRYWFNSNLITQWGEDVCPASCCIQIRKDWLDKLGMEVPTTMDEFYNMLVAFQENDMNGNGVKDEVVDLPMNFTGNALAAWFGVGTNMFQLLGTNDGDEMICPWYQTAEMQEFIKFMQKLYAANLLEVDLSENAVIENRASVIVSYGTEMYTNPTVNVGDAPACEYMPIDAIVGIEGVPSYQTCDPAVMTYSRFAFTKACEDLEAAAILLDFLHSYEYMMLFEFGVEGEAYEMIDGVPTFKEGVGQAYAEQMAAAGITNGIWMHWNAFPRMYPGQDLAITEKAASDYKYAFAERFNDYEYKMLLGSPENYFCAMATEEESETISELKTDLTTASDELFVQLVTGVKSLEDWDAHIQELKDLGLDEYLEVMLGRYERYLNS